MILSEQTLELLEALGDKAAHAALWDLASARTYCVTLGGKFYIFTR